MSLFDDLVTRYRATEIAFPTLKAVTLAQWILESGRERRASPCST